MPFLVGIRTFRMTRVNVKEISFYDMLGMMSSVLCLSHCIGKDAVDRIRTFTDEWPQSSEMKPALLAKAGFEYKGPGDTVSCSGCNVEFCQWEATDDPVFAHAFYCPDCPFVQDQRESGGYCPAAEVIISDGGHPPHLVLKAFLWCKLSEHSLHYGFMCLTFNLYITANTATGEQSLRKAIGELRVIEGECCVYLMQEYSFI